MASQEEIGKLMKKFDLMKGKLEEWTKSGSLCCSWLILGWEFNVSFEVVSRLILHGIRTEFMKILAYILTLGKFFLRIEWVCAVHGLGFYINS